MREYAEVMNSAIKIIKKHTSQCRSDRHMKTIIFSTLRWTLRRNDKMISERQKSTGYSFTMDKRFGWMVPKGVNNKQFPEFIPYQTFVAGEKIKIGGRF